MNHKQKILDLKKKFAKLEKEVGELHRLNLDYQEAKKLRKMIIRGAMD